jgi:uncharacterized membrane protein YeaQ/YmgE (transglycosylase-associated protein family)
VLGLVLTVLLVGLVAGFLARVIVPGPDPIGISGTIVLGVIGSFIGGFLSFVVFHRDVPPGAPQPSGIVGSVVGSVIALLVYRSVSGRGRALRR